MALTQPHDGKALGPGVEPAELTGPVEDAVVGGEELVAFEGGGDDYAVGGISVEVGKLSSPDADQARKRQFR